MQSTHSIEAYAYRTCKDLVSEKEKIKCNNLIKRYKTWLMMLQKNKKNKRT